MLPWHDILGHAEAKDVLGHAVASGTLHHGLLFAGPKGVGKRHVALGLAAAINCTRRPQGQWQGGCMECIGCRKLAQGIHPDMHVVEAVTATIKIDQIRQLQKLTSRAPYEAKERVILILHAHTMSEEASNALLKTLEEPTKGSRLILTTDQPHKLLPTILSRCQKVRFGPLERDAVVSILKALGQREEWEASQALLEVAAGFGEGSPGRASEAIEHGILEGRQELVEGIEGLRPERPREVLELAEELGKKNEKLSLQLDVLKTFFRDVMRYNVRHAREELIHDDLFEQVARFQTHMTLEGVLGALLALEEAQGALGKNANAQMVMERLLRTLCTMTTFARAKHAS